MTNADPNYVDPLENKTDSEGWLHLDTPEEHKHFWALMHGIEADFTGKVIDNQNSGIRYYYKHGGLHREDGPAVYPGRMRGFVDSGEWWYHGEFGLEYFPDSILAKIGDTVI